ncbi:MAG: 2-amino-4-hydroxy-6-hydroxymethyldihydropteridine diphosphokinase [Rhodospirillaceae bacterium]|jgi:2-amino-4-hydroxy-6-hydroxymethyldihydropteridine diphosphokinase|nr:2-amino-4-hydroxy-6-hydroxymethyldihydropteridine diphosphokinase [Rhodospirillales bacterium]MBT3907400.1 2-amino-4-hydroxy-6-hydroxymethyldihydropteridine diphosphokinase [Rhodospirillaceae bacterium]MBT4701705.1 2-amino-4-hydroxy-6-hydroxymethyldihydropteridine diphosphokinase [Rhodospirillaceae bacterium]MBT5035311.1 2-amino-4-hydroxy-6-hydroxymethyldihydropteridine diphosphokinase [Rhodospirillaceae bacterium]MBT6221845.1 2-amino-4-hydroxy-6-hydroxymethyldihydropteridine diphosphokinase
MIIIGLGTNLKVQNFSSLRETCGAAMVEMEHRGLKINRYSSWYQSPPWPPSDQPWYVNGVCAITTELNPIELLEQLFVIEQKFGRKRSVKNAPRTLDLDILAYNGVVTDAESDPILPHPRLFERAFVLYPIRDIAPDWRHPETGNSVSRMIKNLPQPIEIKKMTDGEGAFKTEWVPPS